MNKVIPQEKYIWSIADQGSIESKSSTIFKYLEMLL